jgi:hypothetical protein
MGTGGSLGNSLFFLLSGLGLSMSSKTKSLQGFFPWFQHRLTRLYLSFWVIAIPLQMIIPSAWQHWGIQDYFYYLLYPTNYWFISALVIFYALLYPIFACGWTRWVPYLILCLLVPYFCFYKQLNLSVFSIENAGYFKWIFYFQIMLFGVWASSRYQSWKAAPEKLSKMDFVWLTVVLLAYFLFKLFISKGCFLSWQFIAHWLTFPFVYYGLKCSTHPTIESFLQKKRIKPIINLLGSSTLEIYLLQFFVYSSPFVSKLIFPINIFVFWAVTVTLACLLQLGLKPLHQKLRNSNQLNRSYISTKT